MSNAHRGRVANAAGWQTRPDGKRGRVANAGGCKRGRVGAVAGKADDEIVGTMKAS